MQKFLNTFTFAAKLDSALAQARDLQKRLFSTKSEPSRPSESCPKAAACRKHGQQTNSAGHGRTIEAKLIERHEDVVLEKAQCPEYGRPSMLVTEDGGVLTIELPNLLISIRQKPADVSYLEGLRSSN